jgi:vacuolar-type H+-ATPase subunit H
MSEAAYEDDYVTDESPETTAPVDVAALITQGLNNLNELRDRCAEADARLEQARIDAETSMQQYKERAQATIAEARSEATEAVEQVRREMNERVAEVKASVDAELAQVKATQYVEADEAEAAAATVRAQYRDLIEQLIQTGWATPGALASMGHAVVKKRGRKPAQ